MTHYWDEEEKNVATFICDLKKVLPILAVKKKDMKKKIINDKTNYYIVAQFNNSHFDNTKKLNDEKN